MKELRADAPLAPTSIQSSYEDNRANAPKFLKETLAESAETAEKISGISAIRG